MAVNDGENEKKYSPNHIQNMGFDPVLQVPIVENVGFDGTNLQRPNADNLAVKVTSVGNITYVGLGAPGLDEATSKWQCFKIDNSSGVKLTFADGDDEFDNVATDLTALTYS